MFEIAEHNRLPVVLLAEGGGGRPGDTDGIGGSGLDCWAFTFFAQLSGLVPLVGVTNGRCFAGNAVLLGCCDVIIATEGSNIGVGRPRHDRRRRLGRVPSRGGRPGRRSVAQRRHRCAGGRRGRGDRGPPSSTCRTSRAPSTSGSATTSANCGTSYPRIACGPTDVREIIDKLCDVDSVMELRRGWGPGCVTAHWHASKGARSAWWPTTTTISAAPSMPTPGDKAARFHPALRRARHPAAVPVRHAGDHGRAPKRSTRPRCAMRPACS